VTKHEEPSTHKLARARWRPMLSTHPYTDSIHDNCGSFQGCVVVSTQLSGPNPDARTKCYDDERRSHAVLRLLKEVEISTLVRVFLGYLACDWSVVAWPVVADMVRVSANVVSPCFVFHFS